MFEGFTRQKIKVSETEINLVTAGNGPPLLLLHGYPQSHIMWHKVAPRLAENFTLVIPDLRGYGDSGIPDSNDGTSALDLSLKILGVKGDDEIIVPTLTFIAPINTVIYNRAFPIFMDADKDLATKYWHWFFLIQPTPVPETLITNSLEFYLRTQFGAWGHGEGTITEEAFAEYLRCFENPDVVHATCEDYRAGASIDLEHDKADIKTKITCPVLALWGARGAMHKRYEVVSIWKERASHVDGRAINSGHFIPEEAPEDLINALFPFFNDD